MSANLILEKAPSFETFSDTVSVMTVDCAVVLGTLAVRAGFVELDLISRPEEREALNKVFVLLTYL